MVSINYSSREVCCKIVYYGPGLSGKTTNLQYVHSKVPSDTRGQLVSLATEADRTLYFDFLPINIGTIHGFQAKFQLYTVPGQVYYNATRKLVLRGVDGIVFVADSQPDKMDENLESLANLVENLAEYGYDIDTIPAVIQYNKRDLPGVLPVEELESKLNEKSWPCFESSATAGNGVFDTLKLIIKLVLEKAKSASTSKIAAAPNAGRAEPAPGVERVAAGSEAEVAGQPAASQVAAAAVGAATEEQSAYRPYPGSDAEIAGEQQAAPAALTPPAGDERDAGTLERDVADKQDNVTQESREAMGTPRMAPSLRRRDESRKRGFFKRLFGIR